MTDAKFGTWAVAESAVDVEYSLVVIEEIRQVVADGFQRLQRGGIEVGGVLYGTRDGRIVRVLAMREIACEHARGPTFHVSDNDRAALTAQLARDKEDMRLEGLLVVGWFLSHTRSDVTLQQSDLDTYNAFFPEPWQVTMVVHPGRAGAMRAGFFVREPDGSVKGERSYLEFDFPDRLAGVLDRAPRERRPPMDPPLADRLPTSRYPMPPDAADLRQTPDRPADLRQAPDLRQTDLHQGIDPRELLEPPPDCYEAPLFGQSSRAISEDSPYPNTGRKMPWAIIGIVGIVVAALITAVAGLKYLGPQLNADPLSLSMIEQNGQLQIQWNHASRSVLNAASGMLEIVDGQDKRDMPLNRAQLAQGNLTYARQSGDVQVRLTVTGSGGQHMAEASRFLGAAPAQGDTNEAEVLKVERDALQDEVTRLRQQSGVQAARIQQLERTLLILQSRLGVAAER